MVNGFRHILDDLPGFGIVYLRLFCCTIAPPWQYRRGIKGKQMKYIATLAAAAVLTACGGGGSDDTSTTTPTTPIPVVATAEGFWSGNASTGPQVQLAILENGETWGFYTVQGALVGALYGNTTSSGTTVTGSGLDFYGGSANPGSYSGTFLAKNSIDLALVSGTSTYFPQLTLLKSPKTEA
jgi:hypothetical protein